MENELVNEQLVQRDKINNVSDIDELGIIYLTKKSTSLFTDAIVPGV